MTDAATTDTDLGRVAYEAFPVKWSGCASFDDIPIRVQNQWRFAAAAVMAHGEVAASADLRQSYQAIVGDVWDYVDDEDREPWVDGAIALAAAVRAEVERELVGRVEALAVHWALDPDNPTPTWEKGVLAGVRYALDELKKGAGRGG